MDAGVTGVLDEMYAAFLGVEVDGPQLLADAHSEILALRRETERLTVLVAGQYGRLSLLADLQLSGASRVAEMSRDLAARSAELEAERLARGNDVRRLQTALSAAGIRARRLEAYRLAVARLPELIGRRRAGAASSARVDAELVVLARRTVETANRRYAAPQVQRLAAAG